MRSNYHLLYRRDTIFRGRNRSKRSQSNLYYTVSRGCTLVRFDTFQSQSEFFIEAAKDTKDMKYCDKSFRPLVAGFESFRETKFSHTIVVHTFPRVMSYFSYFNFFH